MEIKIKKGKEFKKGGFLSGKNVILTLEIGVSLSEEEKALVEKHYDPSVVSLTDLKGYFRSEEAFKVVKITAEKSDLSKYNITAHVDDGFRLLGNIQTFREAVVAELSGKLDYLKSLDA
jgi:hypothetical protein